MLKPMWRVLAQHMSFDPTARDRTPGRSMNASRGIHHLLAILLALTLSGAFAGRPALAVQLITTQDTWLSELAPNTIIGADGALMQYLSVRRSSTQLNLIYVRFDIATLTKNVASAALKLTAQKANAQYNLFVYGAFEDNAGAWDEMALTYNTTAILFPDGVSSSPETIAGHTVLDQFDLVPMGDLGNANAKVSELGSVLVPAAALDASLSFTSAALASFINAARAGSDTTISLLLASDTNIQNYYSKDGTTNDAFKPTLDLAYASQPGDFDGDGDVDGADFVAWQTNFPTASGASIAQGDADGDGDVDGADFVVWQTSFPFTPGPGLTSVPEPTSLGIAVVGLLGAVTIRLTRPRRRESAVSNVSASRT